MEDNKGRLVVFYNRQVMREMAKKSIGYRRRANRQNRSDRFPSCFKKAEFYCLSMHEIELRTLTESVPIL